MKSSSKRFAFEIFASVVALGLSLTSLPANAGKDEPSKHTAPTVRSACDDILTGLPQRYRSYIIGRRVILGEILKLDRRSFGTDSPVSREVVFPQVQKLTDRTPVSFYALPVELALTRLEGEASQDAALVRMGLLRLNKKIRANPNQFVGNASSFILVARGLLWPDIGVQDSKAIADAILRLEATGKTVIPIVDTLSLSEIEQFHRLGVHPIDLSRRGQAYFNPATSIETEIPLPDLDFIESLYPSN